MPGRKKSAAEKSWDPKNPIGNIIRSIFGKFDGGKLVPLVQTASTIDVDHAARLRETAKKETDAARRSSMLDTAELIDQQISETRLGLGDLCLKAIANHDSGFFRELSELVEKFGKISGSVIDSPRYKLQLSFSELVSSHRNSGESQENSSQFWYARG